MALKRRVVLLLCFCDGVLFRTKRFLPDYRYTAALVGNRNADEVVVVDVTPADRRAEQRGLFYEALQRYAAQCFSPITVGGGVRTVEEVGFLMRECGADKVVIGVEALSLELADEITGKFGRQALTMACNHGEEAWPEGRPLVASPIAGELLLNSVLRDGSLGGYDLGMLRTIAPAVDVPVMVAGGCGTWAHMAEAFDAGADAACTSVIHHFTETSLKACKEWLVAHGQPVRPAEAAA